VLFGGLAVCNCQPVSGLLKGHMESIKCKTVVDNANTTLTLVLTSNPNHNKLAHASGVR